MEHVLSSLLTGVAALLGVGAGGSIGYLLLLLAAATRGTGRTAARALPPDRRGAEPRVAVVIPAHDEEAVLGATLESLRRQDYPAGGYAVFVVADNCTDATAEVARRGGAAVLERTDPSARGKGYALAWAFARLLSDPTPADVFIVMDADTWAAPDLVRVLAVEATARADARGWCALQGRYGVLNPRDGWRAALMAAALDLVNHIKPLGRERLGLSAGLKGNGMAFTRPVLEGARWSGASITEDIDYGLDLLCRHGCRVQYVADAVVRAQMPVTAAQADSQRRRWERGRYRLMRGRALPLLWQGLRRWDARLWDAGLDLLLPPLAELAGLLAAWGAVLALGAVLHRLPHPAGWAAAWGAAAAGLGLYVMRGLRVAGAPRAAFAALWKAPAYAAWKFALYATRPARRGGAQDSPDAWVRTERRPLSSKGISE